MPGRSRRVLKLAAWALFVPLGITLVSLAIPLRVWRTGRLETPPLALVRGDELMTPPSRIWVDTDAACGATRTTDPDDCLALVWLAAHGVNLAGLSFGYGNADLETVEHTTAALATALAHSGLSRISTWRGAAGPLEKSGPAPAHAALRAELERGPLTILALGPLTHVATVLRGRPDLKRNVARLIAVMGHRPGHLFHPSEGSGRGMLLGHGPIFRDLNFAKDAAAAQAALRISLPLTLVPYDAARRVQITAKDLDRLSRRGPAFAWAAERARGWLDYWRDDIGQPGFYPFDWVAAAFVLKPDLFRCAVTRAWVADEWAFWVYPRPSFLVGPSPPANAKAKAEVTYCPEADPPLHAYLMDETP